MKYWKTVKKQKQTTRNFEIEFAVTSKYKIGFQENAARNRPLEICYDKYATINMLLEICYYQKDKGIRTFIFGWIIFGSWSLSDCIWEASCNSPESKKNREKWKKWQKELWRQGGRE